MLKYFTVTVIQFSKSFSKCPFNVNLLVLHRQPEEATSPSSEAQG